MKTSSMCFCAIALLLLVTASSFAFEREQILKLPLSDGAELDTNVYLPQEGAGPWPVLLVRSSYGRDFPVQGLRESDWVRADYALVVQDVRGTPFTSTKMALFYADSWRDDVHDGRDTYDWIVAQPWCNGQVGTLGESGLGMTAFLLGPAAPKLRAQFIVKAPPSFYRAVFYGGVFQENLVFQWLTTMGSGDIYHTVTPDIVGPKQLTTLGSGDIYPVFRSHLAYGEFWRPYDTLALVDKTEAAGFFVGAWYDVFQQGILDAFTTREYGEDSLSRGMNYLVMQPDTHRECLSRDYTFRDPGGPNTGDLRRRFFDYRLRGDLHALDGIPKVQYFTLGADTPADAPGNVWRNSDRWPPADARDTPFYLTTENGLSREAPAATPGTLEFAADPAHPYPTWGGPNLSYNVPIGPYDQRARMKERTDLVQFATPPLDVPVEIAGRVRVKLYISTDAPDTDFTAKLVDIYPEPDGRVINLLDGIQRLKYRRSVERTEPYTPGTVTDLEIDLWSTSFVFAPGHRIGLHVAGSNAPRFSVNPNTGVDYIEEGAPMAVAHNTIHLSEDRPSALILPECPWRP